jgi:uncharacterized membrane protein YeaQ/YmgE (transglycosylase-associated protein family)
MFLTEALVLGLITGGLGGNLLGMVLRQYSLGSIGNTIAGVAGGAALSQLLFTMLPILEKASSSPTTLSFAGAIAHVIVGALGGALLTMIIGVVKNNKSMAS